MSGGRVIGAHMARLWREQRVLLCVAAGLYVLLLAGVFLVGVERWLRVEMQVLTLMAAPLVLAVLIDADHMAGERKSHTVGLLRRLPGGLRAACAARLLYSGLLWTVVLASIVALWSALRAVWGRPYTPGLYEVLDVLPGPVWALCACILLWSYVTAACTGSGVLAAPAAILLGAIAFWPLWIKLGPVPLISYYLLPTWPTAVAASCGAILTLVFLMRRVRRFLTGRAGLIRHALPLLALTSLPAWVHASVELHRDWHAVPRDWPIREAALGAGGDVVFVSSGRAFSVRISTGEVTTYGAGTSWAQLRSWSDPWSVERIDHGLLARMDPWDLLTFSRVDGVSGLETPIPAAESLGQAEALQVLMSQQDPRRHPGLPKGCSSMPGRRVWCVYERNRARGGQGLGRYGYYASHEGRIWTVEELGGARVVLGMGELWMVELEEGVWRAFDHRRGVFLADRELHATRFLEPSADGRVIVLGEQPRLYDWHSGTSLPITGLDLPPKGHADVLAGFHDPAQPLLLQVRHANPAHVLRVDSNGHATPLFTAGGEWRIVGYPDDHSLLAIRGHELVRFDWEALEVEVVFPPAAREVSP